MIITCKGKTPKIADDVFVAENAVIIGDVEIGPGSSVWFGAVIRGDNDSIRIGRNSNVQDNCTLHSDEGDPITIGDNVTIGHNAVVHGCTLDDNVLVGMNSTVLNGAHIRRNSLIGAGAMVKGNSDFPEGSMIVGAPAIVKSPVKQATVDLIADSAQEYVDLSKIYRQL
ncbi:MAG: gamma carbonic anhydrase family protein [Firmicutes bacterium]|nr:gamma carbonic anhydrase family protein [Bacillota bacterium]MBR6351758.1 gamma carbonic anhydrase family protein [Bacillota bacterium]